VDLDVPNETVVCGANLVFEVEKLAWAPELENIGLVEDWNCFRVNLFVETYEAGCVRLGGLAI